MSESLCRECRMVVSMPPGTLNICTRRGRVSIHTTLPLQKDPFHPKENENMEKEQIVSKYARRQKKGSRILIGYGVLTALLLVAWIPIGMAYEMAYEPEYNKAVRGHMESAYYADTPELMIKELRAARQGMVSLGLEPGDYATSKPWRQTPDQRMDYQYNHLDAIIHRAQAVIEWRDGGGANGEINDVYGSKMRDLRAFIKEDGWSDDIAKGAWMVKNHAFLDKWFNWSEFFMGGWAVGLLLLGVPAGVLIWTGSLSEGLYRLQDYRGRVVWQR